ncbi:ABC transporter ATP-binding protein [Luxibacter massiliensis]|uniref:ABC transporter ATP-binding protein n=1 Tax=Luxibacter massiliensis TaxID=2219695 RepID=UPI000F0701D5|nr:ABC transporter ATP-binding protein [Luxibacter massiliensis]
MKRLLNTITCNEPKRLIKPVFWNALANLSNLLPFVCLSYIISQIYAYFISSTLNRTSLWTAWAIMLACFVLTWIFENIACKLTYRDGFMASADGRIKLAEHIRRLPLGFLRRKNSGEIGNTMMNDFSRTESAMTHILPQIISGAIMALIASVVLLIMDPRMGLAMFAGFPIALLIMFGMRGLERRLDTQLSQARVNQAGKLQEYLYGMRIIKSYNMQGENFEKLKKACMDYRDACIKVEGGIGPMNLVAAAFLRSGLSLMTVVGVFLVTGGTLTVPDFALFLLVGTRVFDPLSVAIMNYSELMMCSMSGERICTLLDNPKMSGSGEAPKGHEICLDHVCFGYKVNCSKETKESGLGRKVNGSIIAREGGLDCGGNEVLHDISARLEPGTITAIVGPSGSGKSTMLKLIARFYDPSSGKVLFGGKDERDIEPEKLMKNISMVFQDVYLFQDSVANNIRYGKENATQEEIVNAARLANCYDFIMQMPDSFDTMIGEGGSTLSGGEKQRISIARAILKDAPVVLLDEATSSLDPENETEIQQAISRLVYGRTVVVIAHRLKTVTGADTILVLDQGRIVEQGTHKQLLAQNGLYAKLWNLQTSTEGWKV